MIFQQINKKDDWAVIDYTATWKYGYDFMLDAAQGILDSDFRERLQRVETAELANSDRNDVTEAVRAAKGDLRACRETSEECGMLTVAGISGVMGIPVQFIFFNQTNHVRLISPAGKFFDDNGEHVFDNYMNSAEIKAHCTATERRVRREIEEQGKAE